MYRRHVPGLKSAFALTDLLGFLPRERADGVQRAWHCPPVFAFAQRVLIHQWKPHHDLPPGANPSAPMEEHLTHGVAGAIVALHYQPDLARR